MKKLLFSGILAATLSVSILFSGCNMLKSVGGFLSEYEMIMGLKEALTQGLFRGFDAFANPDQGNALVRFAFPGEAAQIESSLRKLGLTTAMNRMTSKFTNAMGQAVSAAKPMFVNSIKRMSIKDAARILFTDNRHAATQYFKAEMSPQLMSAFQLIVDSTIRTSGAGNEYESIARAYNAIPFLDIKLEPSLNSFIAGRAIDAMFLYVASEEENIREKVEFRKTDLLKKVFGYAEQQLKNKTGMTN